MSDRKDNVISYLVIAFFIGLLFVVLNCCSQVQLRRCDDQMILVNRETGCPATK